MTQTGTRRSALTLARPRIGRHAFTEDSWDYVRLDEAEAIRQASGVRNLAAKNALLHEIRRRAASNTVLAADLGAVFASGRTPEWFDSVRDRLAAISAADVQRVAQQYLQPAHAQIGVYGGASLRHRFARLGSVKTYLVGKQEAY